MAVLRRAAESVRALLELDFPVGTKNRTGWKAMDEAVAGGSYSMVASPEPAPNAAQTPAGPCPQLTWVSLTQVRMLHEHASGKATRDFQKNKPQLLATLADMPDFQMQVVVSPFLHHLFDRSDTGKPGR